MVWPTHKPPSGIPASGIPSKPSSAGEGWGGRPTGKPARPFQGGAIDRSPEAVAERVKLAVEREERIAQLTDNLGDLALNAEREETRVSATVAALNRLEGMPKQRNENLNAEVTFEKLVEASLKPKKTE